MKKRVCFLERLENKREICYNIFAENVSHIENMFIYKTIDLMA